jgi:hypothetical protein
MEGMMNLKYKIAGAVVGAGLVGVLIGGVAGQLHRDTPVEQRAAAVTQNSSSSGKLGTKLSDAGWTLQSFRPKPVKQDGENNFFHGDARITNRTGHLVQNVAFTITGFDASGGVLAVFQGIDYLVEKDETITVGFAADAPYVKNGIKTLDFRAVQIPASNNSGTY